MNFTKGFFLLMVLLTGCQPTTEEVQQAPTTPVFFDLKGYFSQEVKRLNGLQPNVNKTVAINDKTEVKQLSKLEYDRELDIFIQADINRIDWVDKYSVDSTFQNRQLTAIQYIALDEKLRTRHVKIDFQNGSVSRVYLENGGNNMAAGSEQQLTYQPDSAFHIQSIQHTALADDKKFRIEVKFLD